MEKINWQIPSIEDVYNEYHKQTFYIRNGVYPRTIKNFSNLYDDTRKVEYIKYFIEFIQRNRAAVDWKLYILALAKVLRTRFDLKYLGTFAANKIYRDYVKTLYIDKTDTSDIYNEIIRSLQFLTNYLNNNQITFKEYLDCDRSTIPLSLKHIYAGTISVYFYACFSSTTLGNWFNYEEDVFQELFKLSKYEFLDTFIVSKRNKLLTNNKIQNLIFKLEEKFNKYF